MIDSEKTDPPKTEEELIKELFVSETKRRGDHSGGHFMQAQIAYDGDGRNRNTNLKT